MSISIRLFLSRASKVTGFATIIASSYDAKLLFLQRFARLFAYGATFIILVHFLASLDISNEHIGLFMTLTMLGDVGISFVLTLITDQVGRRKVLAAGAILMAMSGIVFSLSSTYWVLLLASIFGVISPSGNEIGPFRAVEESILAQLTAEADRSDIFVWYSMCGTAGQALGTVTSGWLIQGLQNISWRPVKSYRIVFIIYAALGVLKLVLTLIMSGNVELKRRESAYNELTEIETESLLSDGSSDDQDMDPDRSHSEMTERKSSPTIETAPSKTSLLNKVRSFLPDISQKSYGILVRLIFLFFLDSFASGLASPSWLTYFFTEYHGIAAAALGSLFFVTNLLATLSNFAALPLARRLGPLKTMTFTHLPSAIFLALIPLPPHTKTGTWLSMASLALRACTQSMDQAPRQAFLAAAVLTEERTAILGVVNVVKTIAQAAGIGSAGLLAERKWWIAMFGGAGLMKATYDGLILWAFLGMKSRSDEEEERERNTFG